MLYLIPVVVSFIVALIFLKPTMKFLFRAGIRGIDQQKKNKPELPTSMGVVVLSGLLAGIFAVIGLNTFVFNLELDITLLFAGLTSILIVTFIGFLDDINVSRSPKLDKGIQDIRIGLKQWQKPLLTFPAAIPLMAVAAGVSEVTIPFIGIVNIGILYPLLIVPLAVIFVTNSYNMLAGMNGLETGLGIISTFFLGLYAYFTGSVEGALILFSATGALLALLKYNWYPARVLPGDSLTYLIGAAIVSGVIIANIEQFAIVVYLPWILEFILKARSKFKGRSLGVLQSDGTLKPSSKKTYSFTTMLVKVGINKEKRISGILILSEFVLCLSAFIYYYSLWVF